MSPFVAWILHEAGVQGNPQAVSSEDAARRGPAVQQLTTGERKERLVKKGDEPVDENGDEND